jgi:hypothetical protein
MKWRACNAQFLSKRAHACACVGSDGASVCSPEPFARHVPVTFYQFNASEPPRASNLAPQRERPLDSTRTSDHASALQRMCSITRRTRLCGATGARRGHHGL